MSSIRLILAVCISCGVLLAQNPDAFASYHQAVENQLSAMLDRQQSARSAVPEAMPVPQSARVLPKNNSEADVKTFANRYWGGRESEFGAAFARLQRIRPALESILEAEGVPKDLVAVVLVESGAQPLALSPRQARGLWQIIPETARRYGLVVSAAKDERIELESATRAAASYLRDLYGRFGSWPLALAAYNAGENAIQSALGKGRARSFAQLSAARLLPAETRAYVPAVLAAMGLLDASQPHATSAEKTVTDTWVYATAGVAK
jgi:soluble lytic murein transglycosylase-like protein